MKLSGVIFDFDGTLANTIPVCCAAFRAAIRDRVDREYSDADIIALFGPSEEGIIRSIAGEDWEACFATFLTAYEDEHALYSEPFPDVARLLDTLRDKDVPLGIVTGKGLHSAEISLRLLGLAEYFDPIETGSPDGGIKPEAIRRVLARWGLPAAEVAYIGDTASDMDDARASGTIPVAAAWASTANLAALERATPHALFRRVDALLDWLCRHVDA
ncbi:MAG TPA: HAD family hydrolase [Thermomicrobiales bacterium]|nr:HAD family hydrolase [Thermomicrobiales bacterium]